MTDIKRKANLNFKTIIISFVVITTSYFGFQFLNFSTDTTASDDTEYTNYISDHYKIFALDIPDTMSFAGEKVPLELIDIRERLDREMLVNTYWQSQGLLFHKRANRWFPIIEPILAQEGVPDDFKYLAVAESGLTNARSHANAVGFWQFLESSAKAYNLEIRDGIDERYNLEKSTRAAAKMLKKLKETYGSWTMAAAAYNLGQGNLNKQIKRQNTSNYYDLLLVDETSRYVFRIMAIKEILSNSNKYGFHFRPKDLYQPYGTLSLQVDSTVNDFTAFAQEFGVTYKTLKILNPWLRDTYLKNEKSTIYNIKIPANDFKGLK